MTMTLPEYLQTKTYAAIRLRQVLLDLNVKEGITEMAALAATQRASGGANLSVDVAAGPAFVQGDVTSRQGLYHVYNDAVVNLAIGTNTSGNPRIDQVVARVYDSTDGLGGSDQATLEILPGSPQAGATLDNRNGAAALPQSVMRIADIVVASGASSIVNANIRDRRPWARPMIFTFSGVSSFDIPIDTLVDEMITMDYQVETSAPAYIGARVNGLATNIYTGAVYESWVSSGSGLSSSARGGHAHGSGMYLGVIPNPVSAGGQGITGHAEFSTKLYTGGYTPRIMNASCAIVSLSGSGNHAASTQQIGNFVTLSGTIYALNIVASTGTLSGRFVVERK